MPTGNLLTTIFQDAIVNASDAFTSFENKFPSLGALQAIEDQKDLLISRSSLESAKNSLTQPTKIPVLPKYVATDTDADACTITGDTTASAFVNPTYADFGFSVSITPEVHGHNYVGMAETLAHELRMGWKKVFSRLDAAAVAHIAASTDALTGVTSQYFTNNAGTMDYALDPTKIYAYMPALLNKLDLRGGFVEVANTEALTSNLIAQSFGNFNQQNIAGFNGGLPGSDSFTTYTTNNVALGTGEKEVRYVFERGSHAILNWNPLKGRENYVVVPDTDYWTTMRDPFFGYEWTVHYQKKCADVSATYTGLDAATVVETWRIFSNFAFLEGYSSDTTSQTIRFAVK